MDRSILFINQYASDLETGFGGRSYYLSKEIAKLGYKSALVSADFTHLQLTPQTNNAKYQMKTADGVEHIKIRVMRYQGARSYKRVLNWFLFSWRLLAVIRYLTFKPSIVICSSPSIFSIWGAWALARMNGAKFILEVRDIWPLTILSLGTFSKWHPLILFMTMTERFGLKYADGIIGSSEAFKTYLNENGAGNKKFLYIPNGFESSDYENISLSPPFIEKGLDQILVGYVGTLGAANTLETFINAAAELKDDSRFVFALVGQGAAEIKLKELALQLGADNVHFFQKVSKQQVPGIMAQFDIGYIGWRDKPLYRYGISPNKLAEYMGAGVPIAHSYSGAGDLVEKYKAGFTVPAQNVKALSDSLLAFSKLSKEKRAEMSKNGREAARKMHDFSVLAGILDDFIQNELPCTD